MYVCGLPRLTAMTRADLESLFLEHISAIESILNAVTRRYALSPADAEEFNSWAKLRLIENDYAILAKFRGESSLPTYLTVVCAMLFREHRVREWGRWRPSALARRKGPTAVRLETLVVRDGLSLTAAAELMRTLGETTLSDRDLGRILSALPRRVPHRPMTGADALPDLVAEEGADALVDVGEREADASMARTALHEALRTLPPEDQAIVRLHYIEGLSVADVARGLALPQKPLYRRLDRALSHLRKYLERSGVSRERVREIAVDPN